MHAFDEVDVASLASWLEKGEKVRLVDVRSQAEYAQGIIEGGESLPLHMVPLQMPTPQDGEKLVIYCRTGMRSGQACGYLAQQGIEGALNLSGGIMAWARAGYSVVQPSSAQRVG